MPLPHRIDSRRQTMIQGHSNLSLQSRPTFARSRSQRNACLGRALPQMIDNERVTFVRSSPQRDCFMLFVDRDFGRMFGPASKRSNGLSQYQQLLIEVV